MNDVVVLNVAEEGWLDQAVSLALEHHLICTGSVHSLRWFGTQLIAQLGKQPDTETCPVYGQHIENLEQFAYQLGLSTTWGAHLATTGGAISEGFWGDTRPENRFFIWYDAEIFYKKDFEVFNGILDIMFDCAKELQKRKTNFKGIILLEEHEKVSMRRILRRREKHPIQVLRVVYNEG